LTLATNARVHENGGMATEHAAPKARGSLGKVAIDTSGLADLILAVLGDRLGLFKELATGGPATSEELARRAGVTPHHSREWLDGMASAGYLEYSRSDQRFTLVRAKSIEQLFS
jgi:hypothetical protein